MGDFCVWVPLVPIDLACGGMAAYARTHHAPEMVAGAQERGRRLAGADRQRLGRRRTARRACPLEPGDVVIMGKRTMHESMANSSDRMQPSCGLPLLRRAIAFDQALSRHRGGQPSWRRQRKPWQQWQTQDRHVGAASRRPSPTPTSRRASPSIAPKHGIDRSPPSRTSPCWPAQALKRFLAHVELFKMTLDVPGDIAEFGVLPRPRPCTWANLLVLLHRRSHQGGVGLRQLAGLLPASPEQDSMPLADAGKAVGGFNPARFHQEVLDADRHLRRRPLHSFKPRIKLIDGNIEDTVREVRP